MNKPIPRWKVWLIAAIVTIAWAAHSNEDLPTNVAVGARPV
ncbi:hypothetical protein BCO18442_03516 [Burkholderia contaminans]|nr:hypothetical protein BCO18442_03516 [Burkholderia contaminans]